MDIVMILVTLIFFMLSYGLIQFYDLLRNEK